MMTNDEGGTILRNMKDEYVNGGMLSTAEVRGDIGDPTNLLIHRNEVTAKREKGFKRKQDGAWAEVFF